MMATGETDQMLHERLMRIEEKVDRVNERLADGSRRMDAIENSQRQRPCEGHEGRIAELERTNKRALAAWGVIVLVGTAIVSVAWEEIKKRLIGP